MYVPVHTNTYDERPAALWFPSMLCCRYRYAYTVKYAHVFVALSSDVTTYTSTSNFVSATHVSQHLLGYDAPLVPAHVQLLRQLLLAHLLRGNVVVAFFVLLVVVVVVVVGKGEEQVAVGLVENGAGKSNLKKAGPALRTYSMV